VFGCGYLGQWVAKKAVLLGHGVWASTRSAAKAARLAAAGIEPVMADWTDRGTLRGLPQVDQVLISVSYDRHSTETRYDVQVGGLRNLLAVISPATPVCYISTTGVYGQTDGGWVDEDSPACPTRDGGQVHLQAEASLQQLRPETPWTILRLAGIYGPGRVPRAADVVAGRPIASAEDGYLNLIHVADAASAVIACWTRSARRMYLVSDDCPVLRAEFYRELSRQCAAPPPVFVPPPPESSLALRSAANKRISNQRMKQDLVPALEFPSYREGLQSVLGAVG
jgi:nucleoside-diphosphate-sugar epimerase